MSTPFVISKVSWLTQTAGNEGRRNAIIQHFFSISNFLQKNGLVRHSLIIGIEDIDDNFAIKSDDLTEEGLVIMKSTYDNWIAKIDHGMDPADVSLLDQALAALRKSS